MAGRTDRGFLWSWNFSCASDLLRSRENFGRLRKISEPLCRMAGVRLVTPHSCVQRRHSCRRAICVKLLNGDNSVAAARKSARATKTGSYKFHDLRVAALDDVRLLEQSPSDLGCLRRAGFSHPASYRKGAWAHLILRVRPNSRTGKLKHAPPRATCYAQVFGKVAGCRNRHKSSCRGSSSGPANSKKPLFSRRETTRGCWRPRRGWRAKAWSKPVLLGAPPAGAMDGVTFVDPARSAVG